MNYRYIWRLLVISSILRQKDTDKEHQSLYHFINTKSVKKTSRKQVAESQSCCKDGTNAWDYNFRIFTLWACTSAPFIKRIEAQLSCVKMIRICSITMVVNIGWTGAQASWYLTIPQSRLFIDIFFISSNRCGIWNWHVIDLTRLSDHRRWYDVQAFDIYELLWSATVGRILPAVDMGMGAFEVGSTGV